MNDDAARSVVLRRILVALDASPHSLGALGAAVELAARFEAELLGLFVEDINLLRLGDLPFSDELGLVSAIRRSLETTEVERQLRARAVDVRRTLQAMADRAQVHWEFQMTRGPIVAELLKAAAEVDLIILGKKGWTPGRRRQLGSTARAAVYQAPTLTLITGTGVPPQLPMAVVYDGTPLAQRALAVASALARLGGGHLLVLILTGPGLSTETLHQEAVAALHAQPLETHYRVLTLQSVGRLAHMLRLEGGGTLVLPGSEDLLQHPALQVLLEETESPVLLVR